jgi:hypothetical protein
MSFWKWLVWSQKWVLFLDFDIDSVFSVGMVWYFLGIYHTNTKGKLGW